MNKFFAVTTVLTVVTSFLFSQNSRKLKLDIPQQNSNTVETQDTFLNDSAVPETRFVFQEGHRGDISDINLLQFSNDGKWFVSYGKYNDKTLKIWETETGRLLRSFPFKSLEGIECCSLNNDGSLVAYDGYSDMYGNNKNIVINNLITDAEEKIERKVANVLLFSHSGKYLLIDNVVYDIQKKQDIALIPLPQGFEYVAISSAAWKNDETEILVGYGGKGVYVYSLEKNEIVKKIDGLGGECVAYSPDGKYFAYTSKTYNNVSVLDSRTYNKICTLPYSDNTYRQKNVISFDLQNNITVFGKGIFDLRGKKINNLSGIFSPDGSTLAVCNEFGLISFYDSKSLVQNNFSAEKMDSIYNSSFSNKTDTLLITTVRGFNYIFKITNQMIKTVSVGKIFSKNILDDIEINYFKNNIISNDGKYAVYRNDEGNLCLYDIAADKIKYILKDTQHFTNTVSFTEDNAHFYAASNYQLKVWNVKTGTLIKTVDWTRNKKTFDKVILFSDLKKFISNNGSYGLELFDGNGNLLQTITTKSSEFYLNEKIKKLILNAFPRISSYDVNSFTQIKTIRNPSVGDVLCFSYDNKRFAVGGHEDISIHDAETLKQLKLIDTKENSDAAFFSSDGKLLITVTSQTVRLWDIESGALVATTLFGRDGEWLTYTPEGFFSGTEWATKNLVHLVSGMKILSLDQLYDKLYRPDLVAAKLAGKDISKMTETVSLASLVSSGEAPLVKFSAVPEMPSSRSVTVDLNVQDIGGGIGSVYLKHNGKVIKVSSGADKSRSFSVNLMLGSGENTLEAYAMNKAEKIESRRASAKITWHGVSAEPNLYVLAAGVNEYKQKNLKLKFSVPDAASISEQFEKYAGNLYKSVKIRTLFDSDVTKDSLAAAFNQIEKEIKPDDIFVLYLAGHGITYSADGNYYYIPSDFTGMQGSDLPEQAVSRHFIVENMSKLTAYRMLVLLDTCQSGGFASTSDDMGFQRLSHDIGLAIMAASSAEQAAGEGYNGHGVFTYALLEALSGSSDSDKDGKIFLSEIGDYTKQLVPNLSSRAWGYRQIPQIELRNHVDFPIVGK